MVIVINVERACHPPEGGIKWSGRGKSKVTGCVGTLVYS